jgi:hypothetical protein
VAILEAVADRLGGAARDAAAASLHRLVELPIDRAVSFSEESALFHPVIAFVFT